MNKHNDSRHIAKAAVWTVVGRTVSMSLKFLTVPILARLLMPEEFGAIAVSITVVIFLSMLGAMGIPSALVADKDDVTTLWNQAFTYALIVGCFLAVASAWGSGLISQSLGAADIKTVLVALSFLIPLNILGDISEAALTKRMQFDKLAIWQVLADVMGALAAISAALAHWGVWALVIQQFVSAAIRVAGNLTVMRIRPRPVWPLPDILRMGHFGSRVMFSDLLLYFCIQGPIVIVTRMLGTSATGLFSVPNRFVELPNQIILSSLASVLFPSFVSMADQPERLSRALLRSAQLTTSLQAPVMFGLAAVAEHAMYVLFGEKWIEAWPVFAILALSKGMMAPCGGFGSFLKGIGQATVLWRLTALRAVLIVSFCVTGVLWGGLIGLTLGILFSNTVFMLVYCSAVFRIAEVGIRQGLSKVLWIIFQAIVMASIAYSVLWLLSDHALSSWVQLMIAVALCGAIYSAMVFLFQQTTKETFLQLIRRG
jgi:succinoglycan exporter